MYWSPLATPQAGAVDEPLWVDYSNFYAAPWSQAALAGRGWGRHDKQGSVIRGLLSGRNPSHPIRSTQGQPMGIRLVPIAGVAQTLVFCSAVEASRCPASALDARSKWEAIASAPRTGSWSAIASRIALCSPAISAGRNRRWT